MSNTKSRIATSFIDSAEYMAGFNHREQTLTPGSVYNLFASSAVDKLALVLPVRISPARWLSKISLGSLIIHPLDGDLKEVPREESEFKFTNNHMWLPTKTTTFADFLSPNTSDNERLSTCSLMGYFREYSDYLDQERKRAGITS